MSHVLVVDDELALAELVSINLKHAGYAVTIATNAEQAQQALDSALPDLVVHGWQLPGHSGLQLLKRWRGTERTRELPVIMLSEHAEERDMVAALDAGADDYLNHPFSTNELMARMRAVLRRKAPEALDACVRFGDLRLDPAAHRLSHLQDGMERDVRIGPTEFRMLHFFMANPQRVYSRGQLLDRIWGDHVFIQERTVDVHIQRLRRALGPVKSDHMLESVRGAGYRLTLLAGPNTYKARRKGEPAVAASHPNPCSACPSAAHIELPHSLKAMDYEPDDAHEIELPHNESLNALSKTLTRWAAT
jgi:two-component system phosphate regulon response regulator PhoB